MKLYGVGMSLSLFLVITYVICVAGGYLMPSMHMYKAWEPLLPGFEWLTLKGFVFGLIGSYLYGWYIAIVFVPIYIAFAPRNHCCGKRE